MTKKYDALIIGGGHNGLVCAFYLARSGMKVRVLERRHVVGGAAVTEEFHPGFRNSTASYTVSLLRPKVIADMKLHDHGFRIKERTISNFFPFANNYLKLGGGMARTQAEFARFSQKDADVFPHYEAALEKVADVLRAMSLKTPPNVGGGLHALMAAAGQGWALSGMGIEAQRDMLDMFVKSAREFLEPWYETDEVRSAFAFDAVVGSYAGVSTPGSAYVLLHHVFGEINGKKGMWGHSVGGMGAITQAMAKACELAGVEISLEAPVAKLLTDGGKVSGVRLESGEEIAAPIVAANVGPALLYRQLVEAGDLSPEFRKRIANFKTGSGTFRMNVALSELPDFSVLPGREQAEHHTAGIIIAPGLDYMDAAYDDALKHGWSRKPIVEIKLPTTVDDSL
ncbi:MAG: NAD(P)/FAD-dependent oxidoreductase, partial [Alphaproteobacteria bacterium]|nr:NAD(P)/FAD-dependent oxidoreductase [Alphaproteobacteria bacterium]